MRFMARLAVLSGVLFCVGPAIWALAQDQDAGEAKTAARNRMVQQHLSSAGSRTAGARRLPDRPPPPFLPPTTRRQPTTTSRSRSAKGRPSPPPYDVAFMTEVLEPKPTDKVYEVGTGSGYQSAILSRLVKDVYSVEIHEPPWQASRRVHKELGYKNIHTRVGDGYAGWPEAAPFDAIIVTCAPTKIPQPLIDQLKEGGRMVIPLGGQFDQSSTWWSRRTASGRPRSSSRRCSYR